MKISLSINHEGIEKTIFILCLGVMMGMLQVVSQRFLSENIIPSLRGIYHQIKISTKVKASNNWNTDLVRFAPAKEFTYDNSKQYQSQKISVKTKAYLVADLQTNNIITGENIFQKVPIASLTKIVTAMVALDLAKPTDEFIVTQNSTKQIPTVAGLKPNETFTLYELLHALLLTSGNDAASVIEDNINNKYGTQIFIDAMNQKIKYIGTSQSHFDNPQGFDSNENYSSAYDLAKITEYAIQNYPVITDIVKKDKYTVTSSFNHRTYIFNNWNSLVGLYPETIGMKIGNTPEAGDTSIVIANRNHHSILTVILGVPTIVERDLLAGCLLDYAYETTLQLPPISLTQETLQQKYIQWQQ